jgi:hypothetical protein
LVPRIRRIGKRNQDHWRVIVPPTFDGRAYLTELMQQLPGTIGRIEIARQLAAMIDRVNPFSIGYLYNVRAGRMGLTPPLALALYLHSGGGETDGRRKDFRLDPVDQMSESAKN